MAEQKNEQKADAKPDAKATADKAGAAAAPAAKARKKARKAQKKKGSFLRKKVCRFCADATAGIDYKDPKGLRYFMTETGKLIPQRISGNCAKHQRQIATAIKRARQLALMPYASHHGM